MTAYRKCNICGNVWRTRETSRIPQCSKCRSKSSVAATEAEYIAYQKNHVQTDDSESPSSTQEIDEIDDSESLTDHNESPSENPPSPTNELIDPTVNIDELISGKQKPADKNIRIPHIAISPKILVVVGIGVGVAAIAGVYFFRASRSVRKHQTHAYCQDPQTQETAKKRHIHVAGFS